MSNRRDRPLLSRLFNRQKVASTWRSSCIELGPKIGEGGGWQLCCDVTDKDRINCNLNEGPSRSPVLRILFDQLEGLVTVEDRHGKNRYVIPG